MARFETDGIDDLIQAMESAGELMSETADAMLVAAAGVVTDEWKRAAGAAGHRNTGAMNNSIGFSRKPKTIRDAKRIDIYPRGKDSKGVRNAAKAFTLNYGTKHITGSRFVDVADRNSAPKVEKAMRDIWEQKLQQKGLT